MAQSSVFKPYGGVFVEKGSSYTSADLPATITTVELTLGVRITDREGKDTRMRGVRVTITDNGLTPPPVPLPNVPFIWEEGELIDFIPGAIYTFNDPGVVAYGKWVVL